MSDIGEIAGLDGDEALAAEFVLGLLPTAEHEVAARRIGEDRAFRRLVQMWRRELGGMDAEFAESSVPSAVWGRVQQRLFSSGEAPGTAGKAARWWDSLALWRGLSAAALAVAVIAVGVNIMRPVTSPEELAQQFVAALQAQGESGVEFVAFYDSGENRVRLLGLSGQEVDQKDFELWYIEPNENAVSLGVVPASGRLDVPLDEVARNKLGEGTVLAVTLEQKGGSPTGVAQGPIVAAGPAMVI